MIRIGLPSGPSASSPKASAYLRPSWKTWPISMPRAIDSRPPHRAHRSPSRISTAPISPSGSKSRPRTTSAACRPVVVRAGDPGAARHDERVDEVADAQFPQDLRTDVALDEPGLRREVGRLGLLDLGRLELAASRFRSTSRSPGTPTTSSSHSVVPGARVFSTTFFSVSAAVNVRPRSSAFSRSTSVVDRRRVRGVEHLLGRVPGGVDGRRHGDLDRLGVGGVVAVRALHEGVLAGRRRARGTPPTPSRPSRRRPRRRSGSRDRAGRRSARRHRGARVRLRQPLVVQIEGVGVLHDELAAAQDAGARPGLVAVLRLDLEQRERIVLVGRVLALHQQGEQLLVGRARAGSRRPCGPSAGTAGRRSRSSGRWSRRSRAGSAPGNAPPARRCVPSPRGRSARPCAAPGMPSGSQE